MTSIRFYALSVFVALVPLVQAQSPDWGQCGGIGWTGPTTCNPGWTCTYSNDYHSQCLQTSPDYWFSFGDSYTDTGFNISGAAPGPNNHLGNPAWPGKSVANGPNWIATVTGTSNSGGTTYNYNFATSSAVIDKTITSSKGSSLVEQIQVFNKWNSGSSKAAWASKSTVFSLWFGMDEIDTKVQGKLPNDLSDLGARRFVVLNVPPLERSPKLLAQSATKQASELNQITDFNAKLWTELESLQANLTGSTISRYDVRSFFTGVFEHPDWYGINDTTAYGNGSNYFWVDDHHPSSKVQTSLGGGVLGLVGTV